MRATFADADFQQAMDIVGGASAPADLTAGLGVEWDYLVWVGIGLAEHELGHDADELDAVASGVEAFAGGFLVGAYLRGADARGDRGTLLPHAVEHVRAHGARAVLAELCDLDAVARFELAYADTLVEQLPGSEHDRAALTAPVTALFEAGLAAGLVLGEPGG
ncbi:MAG: hypothetical protein U0R69_14100 [Gaiellales bacterium]